MTNRPKVVGLVMSEPEVSLLSRFIRDLSLCIPGLPWLFIHAADDEELCLNSITCWHGLLLGAGNHSLYPRLILWSEMCVVPLSAVRVS